MKLSPAAFPYSKALFYLSSDTSIQEEQLNDLQQFVEILNSYPKILQFFCSPLVEIKQKEKTLENALKAKIDGQLYSFLLVVLKNGRFKDLTEITKSFGAMVANKTGLLEANLTSAVALDDATTESLINKLESIYHKKVCLKKTVNPQLLGGGILTMGDQLIDFSVKGKLTRLKDNLLSMPV